jgi:hypothetical protein
MCSRRTNLLRGGQWAKQQRAAWAFLLGSAAVPAEGVYRWVDAQGLVHYGDHPPPGVQVETIPLVPAPLPGNAEAAQSIQDYVRTIDERNAERDREAEQKRQDQRQENARKAQCEISRAQRLRLQRPQLREFQPDGSVRRLTEEERQGRILDVEGRIADACSDHP